jgi:opacity protein-like surface antigen
MLHLSWREINTSNFLSKKITRMAKNLMITLALTMLFVNVLLAQSARGNYNYMDFNQKPYYFGITLGYNQSQFKINRSPSFILNDTFRVVAPRRGPGFNLGVVSNLRIGEYFDIRFLPTLSFAERNLSYYKVVEKKQNVAIPVRFEAVLVELPFHFRYKSAPYKDKRLFVIAGVKYTYDVASTSKSSQAKRNETIKIAPTDFSYELGAGVQMYFPYFIFSPEIKFSQGLGNMLIYNGTLKQSTVLEQISSRALTLSFHFEG